ncbi:type 1 glutamine amidotransferase domain-containing protein [Periweissella beninensis]|uniref:Type 1 glutamine amidotransferase n=1 Tax=Periweissella beninensis TaxID=504936 RepID=A0ABT0VFT9_9LACO|nr:type 1 glutamine amidotransferase domain-containing protein [Periweissella beninensis]MBM7543508.1 protease I [Periweissella beninensis]MCM2436490.1 type 1 glutamine amidotransferase [Periweissella beninensis]MCT4396208.1 type 1 glutamine amidotransferase [Periweissella beninensis]
MAKIASIVTNYVEDIELSSPKVALEQAGHTVDIIENTANKIIKGKNGTEFKVDQGIDDTKIADYDALLIPGGFSPDQLRADKRYVDLVKDFIKSDKPIFAICHGPQLFIQTGLTSDLKLTAYTTVRPDLAYAGAKVSDEPVVVDEKYKIITSRTPDDLPAFNTTIIAELQTK